MKELTPQDKESLTRSYNLRIERGIEPKSAVYYVMEIVMEEIKQSAREFLEELAKE